jgi:hypothetical protein
MASDERFRKLEIARRRKHFASYSAPFVNNHECEQNAISVSVGVPFRDFA